MQAELGRHLTFMRRTLFAAILLISTAAIVLVISKRLNILHGEPSIDTLRITVSTTIQTIATVAAISIAIMFLTAQLHPLGSMRSTIASLFRSIEFGLLILCVIVTLSLGLLIIGNVESIWRSQDYMVIEIVIILGITSILLIIPVMALQVENMSIILVAQKLAHRVTYKRINNYGLVEVQEVGNSGIVHYALMTHGLDYNRVDPLRPLHELIQIPIGTRDRLLLGQLIRMLLIPIAKVHGISWSIKSSAMMNDNKLAQFALHPYRSLQKHKPLERIVVTLHILHYCVRLGRNLQTQWTGLDIGRHGLIYNVGDLIVALNEENDSGQAIELCLYAIMHISLAYSEVKPYGRIEPLNILFNVAISLVNSDKPDQAKLCVQVLGCIHERTHQLSSDRSGKQELLLFDELKEEMNRATELSQGREDWLPGRENDDPWR